MERYLKTTEIGQPDKDNLVDVTIYDVTLGTYVVYKVRTTDLSKNRIMVKVLAQDNITAVVAFPTKRPFFQHVALTMVEVEIRDVQ